MWKIEYYNARVKKEIDDFPPGILASYRHIVGLMVKYGPSLKMPYAKPMGNGLWEIRAKGREGIGRAFYVAIHQEEILILHSFIKKTQQTPKHELEIAIRRLKEAQNG